MRKLLLLSLMSVTLFAHAEDRARTLPAFTHISSTGPFNMTVDVGGSQSVVVSGNEKFQNLVKMEVVNNELIISSTEKEIKSFSSDPKILIKLPALTAFKMEGAGETLLNNLAGDRLEILYMGAGHLQATGKVKNVFIKAKGVGLVDAKGLVAENVTATFEGVGAVKVYASESLNAKVNGVGSLNYYGNPKKVNKSAQGIGEVRAGD